MADIVVKYGSFTFSPTPIVSQGVNFIDYGTRWGNTQEIELIGILSGLSGQATTLQSNFALNFTGQFGTLEVFEGNSIIYRWPNIIVDEINFAPNHLFLSQTYPYSYAPYTIKLRSINVPSGVVEPINEYSFNQEDDGTVTVNHKISARGIRTNTAPLTNAINFVKSFTGQNPFSAPLNAAFAPTGSGILLNFGEVIDRAAASYSIHEVYKYNSGVAQPFVENFDVNFSDIVDNEWLVVDFNWKLQGSPVNNNLGIIESGYLTNPLNKISGLGFNTSNFIQNTFNVNRDTGAALVQIKVGYLSGRNTSDLSGYFDYTITLNQDLTTPKEDWKIEGDFVCYGPIDYRQQRLAAFKANSGQGDWKTFLSGVIVQSPIFIYHDASRPFAGQPVIEIHENTGLAQFHISMSAEDDSRLDQLWGPRYTVEVQPSRWGYDFLPAANIEGLYVLQDLQMMTQGHINLNVFGQIRSPHSGEDAALNALNALASIYVGANSYTINENYNTGLLDIAYSREWLGEDTMSTGLLYTRIAGATPSNYLRPTGFKFGF